ncbi:TPA: hypothetical protein DEP34_04860 [Candidatus Uhrbacteria bacterium]|uniref:Uncharacterized protein n=2 Tax=Candidatus Uhriibacteriota TaxID=1752732 RepID=A0A0G1T653_9BACT|nr:MAG: hypothetical protein UX45_C0006G0032 [Candidatus Uhrbacteria bacterium GW2011_GWF2_46_218]KKU40865.1 MAG: hypothetical protein UX57_C0009G0032 [Candidatus Uhrbacteria bacterium GW2011_GWE2_46_68]HBK33902.1 hypothetical protein [Candidatus Uhrbacteria bacterium]HCB19673.1 hypothetical protein [Candidatus Uhrbacteria bacterium]
MNGQMPFTFRPWMWILLFVGTALLLFNYDPVGDLLNQWFGPRAERWATNIILWIAIILFTFLPKKNPPPQE